MNSLLAAKQKNHLNSQTLENHFYLKSAYSIILISSQQPNFSTLVPANQPESRSQAQAFSLFLQAKYILNPTFRNSTLVLTSGCIWPLMLAVRKGEWVDRRLSHSLGRGSGTDSMKLRLSSLILVWWRMISVCVLSTSWERKRGPGGERVYQEGQNNKKKTRG